MRYQLHLFSDASKQAYGCVCYLVTLYADGSYSCSFVIEKSRLATIKTMSVPRLELAAAALATQLNSKLEREIELPLDPSVFWTDSCIVLDYIQNDDKRYQTFVANIISIIRRGSQTSQWRHVKSELNPDDDISRGLTAEALLQSKRWISGL